jgi:hypothetical protein
MVNELYSSYSEMKGWSPDGGSGNPRAFENILAGSQKLGRLKILEIGFGDGSFLDWARNAGHIVTGVEILPECVKAAATRGHDVHLAENISGLEARSYDLILAIDVLEHLSLAQFGDLAKLANSVLKENGLIVARFPNGDSPFSGRYQTGDFTHERPLSSRSINQVLSPLGFVVTRAVNPRPKPISLGASLKVSIAYLVRDAMELFLGYLYFGYRTPMDPNIIVVLKRK